MLQGIQKYTVSCLVHFRGRETVLGKSSARKNKTSQHGLVKWKCLFERGNYSASLSSSRLFRGHHGCSEGSFFVTVQRKAATTSWHFHDLENALCPALCCFTAECESGRQKQVHADETVRCCYSGENWLRCAEKKRHLRKRSVSFLCLRRLLTEGERIQGHDPSPASHLCSLTEVFDRS